MTRTVILHCPAPLMPSAPHPGEMLAEHLALAAPPTELARQLAVLPNRITQIIHGQRSITADTTLRLAHWFRTTPDSWLHLQAAHDLALAQARAAPPGPSGLPSPIQPLEIFVTSNMIARLLTVRRPRATAQ